MVHPYLGAEHEVTDPQDQFQFVAVSAGELEFKVPLVQADAPVGLGFCGVEPLLGPQASQDAVALQVRDEADPEQTPLPPVHV